jgi:type IV secretion system protein TrbC
MLYRTADALNRSLQAARLSLRAPQPWHLPAHAAGTGMPWEGPLDQILPPSKDRSPASWP